jgi:hypothetical protein
MHSYVGHAFNIESKPLLKLVDSYGIFGLEETDNGLFRNILIETGGATKIDAILLVFKATDYNDSYQDLSMARQLSKILTYCQVVNVFVVMTHCDIVDFDASELASQKAKLIEERCRIRIPDQNIIKFDNT